MLRLRLGLVAAATALAASMGAMAACGSLSSGANSFAGEGNNDSGTEFDGSDANAMGLPDSPVEDAAPPDAPEADVAGPQPPGVLFVQASPSLSDQVFCWSVGSAGPSMTARPYPSTTPMPASNYPGVPAGGAVALADASSMLGGDVTIYALDASAVAGYASSHDCTLTNDCSCYNLLRPGGVSAKHQMPPLIPSGTIAPNATVVLWARGCLAVADDPGASVQRCGADWTPATGNLRMDFVSIPGASLPAPEAGVLAVQAAQLSPALALLAGDAGAVVSFGAQGAADANVVTTVSAPDQILPSAPLQVATRIPLASFGQLGFAVDVGGDGGAHLWMSLAQSLDLVDPTQDPTRYFAQPTSYLVTVIGDPAGPPPDTTGDASYDGTGLHLLVLPLP
jgi:hypothetical protein